MCKKAAEVEPWQLKDAPDLFKTSKRYDKAVRDYPFSLQHVPDFFVTQEQIDLWHDDKYVYHDDRMIEWFKAIKSVRLKKPQLKKS